jgi:hypothetical protein
MKKPTRPIVTITKPPPKTVNYQKRICYLVGTYKSKAQAVKKAVSLWRKRRVAIIRKWYDTWRVYDCGAYKRTVYRSPAEAERSFKKMA